MPGSGSSGGGGSGADLQRRHGAECVEEQGRQAARVDVLLDRQAAAGGGGACSGGGMGKRGDGEQRR